MVIILCHSSNLATLSATKWKVDKEEKSVVGCWLGDRATLLVLTRFHNWGIGGGGSRDKDVSGGAI